MERFIRIIRTGSKGSVIVDAACCLPVFIIAMAMLIMLIPQAGIEESAQRGLAKSAQTTIDAVSITGSDGSEGAAAAIYVAAFALYRRSEGNINGVYPGPVYFGQSAVLESGLRIDNIARASSVIRTKMPSADLFFRNIYAERKIVFRPFAGESAEGPDADSIRVYVFPKRGERYHRAGCSVLRNGAVQTVLSAQLRKRLKACSLCDPGDLPNGAPVYMYTAASGSYHRKHCSIVEKCFVSMPRSEAIERGYTPCMICGGGG